MAEETYGQLVARGVELAEKENFAEAIQVLRRATALYPELPEAHYDLGVVYGQLALGDYDARSLFEDRVDDELLFQNAIDAYQHALEIDPRNTAAHRNLGTLYAVHGERDMARQELQHALDLDSNQPEVRDELEELKAI